MFMYYHCDCSKKLIKYKKKKVVQPKRNFSVVLIIKV